MNISAQVLLVIGSVIVISTPILSARPKAKTKLSYAACPPFPYISLDHGKITPIGTQKYLFRCDAGYYLASPPEVRCWKGKWTSTKEPKCLKAEGQCEDPDPLTGGEILGEQRYEGAVIQYMCKPGFILMGEGTRTCLRGGHWSGITPICMDESEPLQNVAERFKEKFVTDMGSHSTDITWDTKRGIQAPCSSKEEEESGFPCQSSFIANPPTNNGIDTSKDLTEYEYDLSPVSIDFPPNDPNFIRKHKRRHKSKRGKLHFKPSLSSITEDVEGEEAEEIFSGDAGSGDENKVLLLDSTPCYKTPSSKNDGQLKNSFGNRRLLPSSKGRSSRNKARGRKRNRKLVSKSEIKRYQSSRYGNSTLGRRTSRRRKISKHRKITVDAESQEK